MYRLATTRRGFLIYLTLVVAALYALRVIFGDRPGNIDVREQLDFIGAWKLGYSTGANPPLFTWLANLAYAVIGEPVAAAELVRFVMLWLACLLTWLAVRRLLVDGRLAALAGLAPFSSIMLGWEAIFRYSNTTMLIMSVAFTFYALVRLDQRSALPSYLLLGVAIGVGLMSKLNYAVFVAALAAGALTDAGLREHLRDWRSFATLGVATAIFSPFLIWFATRSGAVLSHGHHRVTLPPSYEYLSVPVPVSLLLDVVVGVAGIGLPLLVLPAAMCGRHGRPAALSALPRGSSGGDDRANRRGPAALRGHAPAGALLFRVRPAHHPDHAARRRGQPVRGAAVLVRRNHRGDARGGGYRRAGSRADLWGVGGLNW
jgi:hypothetical protein